MNRLHDRGAQLRHDLPGAAGRGEIIAVYQPQYSLTDASIVSAEGLCRWMHPTLGMVAPGEFIPAAEESGLIDEIGAHMIGLGAQTAAHWAGRAFGIQVAINVSVLQLRDPDFVGDVRDSLAEASADPSRVILEITESTAVKDVPRAVDAVLALAISGITISVDDFGNGYSTEEQVSALRATELKVDQRLVQSQDDASAELLARAVAFAKDRKMRIVAEGVETAWQLERVRSLGCDRAQGYLLGRPMPREELDARLARRG